ncbi:hypothetical protein IQ266_09375 [filamentous cyanobacterium LEGE 11480]|uniref:Uncharacterized protein n=1 Tax=Romeriopsis navalis LEGE 11480 TaxID=2777977 RepID=A0A928VNG7_9CYAN|nr:DUF6439 family protein [Romeriopsis navalis]MBE9029936.1 hypothetical protein [Romeriopsis navalis LEGE 11480]
MSDHTVTAKKLTDYDALELAQALAEKSRITEKDWHRLMANRPARAQEQIATALVYLLKDNSEEARLRLEQAVGWLNRSVSAAPCPTHGEKKKA